MVGDKNILLRLPAECDLDDLHKVLLEHAGDVCEFIGRQDPMMVLQNFHNEELEHARSKDFGIQFGEENVRIRKTDTFSGKSVNPRDVVWALYLAMLALHRGQGIDPYCNMGWQAAVRLCSAKYITFSVSVSRMTLCPSIEWFGTEKDFSKQNQELIVSWIRKGRDSADYQHAVNSPSIDGSSPTPKTYLP